MVDVLGRTLDEARAALEAAGLEVVVVETRSPRRVAVAGPLRVVRQRQAGTRVQLVVAPERYAPLPRDPA